MTAPAIRIYTGPLCGYCAAAKRLLDGKGMAYEEIGVGFDASRRREMMERSGGRTSVPQIFIDDEHVGGCDELYALEAEGHLDRMLGLAD